MGNGGLTCRSRRGSPRLVCLIIAEVSHKYAFLSQLPVARSFPSVEKDTHSTSPVCSSRRGELIITSGRPPSRFHNCAVPSRDALARIWPFGDIAMALTDWVCPVGKTTIRPQVFVFYIIIEWSSDAETSVVPSIVQATQYTVPAAVYPLRFAMSLAVFSSQILRPPRPPVAIMVESGE
jgi:hypothetical protein